MLRAVAVGAIKRKMRGWVQVAAVCLLLHLLLHHLQLAGSAVPINSKVAQIASP